MPASEEWRCSTMHVGEIAPASAELGEPFQNKSSKIMHIRRVDLSAGIEQGSPDDAFALEVKKDSSIVITPDGSGVRKMHLEVSNKAGVAGDTGAASAQKSWVFPRGALTLEENEQLHHIAITRNSNAGEKYFADVTKWYHY